MDSDTLLKQFESEQRRQKSEWSYKKDNHIDFEKMAPQDFLKYATSHPWIDKVPSKYKNHPMCPGCEQIALRDKGWSKEKWSHCPNCHRTFKCEKTLYEYMEEKLYRR